MKPNTPTNPRTTTPKNMPILALVALSVSGFIAIITETLPAGLLPQISRGLDISQAYAGQFITAYALGSVLATIPIISLTRNWNRKPLLLLAVGGFFLFNLGTFLLHSYALLLAVRFCAGISAGIIWGLLTGYTVRIVSPEVVGKALAIVGVGQPIALSLGVPVATWLGNSVGWNSIFLIVALLAMALLIVIVLAVPDVAVAQKTSSVPFKTVLANKGVQRVLIVTLFWILAHNLLYTYISPYLDASGLSKYLDWMLFLFGISAIVGIWVTGRFIDRILNKILALHLIVFGVAGILMFLGTFHSAFVFAGIALWGYAFGGAPIMLQKDLADVASDYIDIAQALSVTVFNIAVAGGGFLGGLLLEHLGIYYILGLFVALAILTFLICFGKRRTTL